MTCARTATSPRYPQASSARSAAPTSACRRGRSTAPRPNGRTCTGGALFSTRSTANNEILGEYVCKISEDQDAEWHGRVYNLHNSYYHKTYNYSLDSSRLGNNLRYVNHIGNPTCETHPMRVNGDVCVGIFARSTINPFDELFFDNGPKFLDRMNVITNKNTVQKHDGDAPLEQH